MLASDTAIDCRLSHDNQHTKGESQEPSLSRPGPQKVQTLNVKRLLPAGAKLLQICTSTRLLEVTIEDENAWRYTRVDPGPFQPVRAAGTLTLYHIVLYYTIQYAIADNTMLYYHTM